MKDTKIKQAITLIQSIAKQGEIKIAYSGGKDSDVILHLAKLAKVPFTAIYNCTTIDPPGTIKHCLDNNVIIQRPRFSFLQLIERKGLPSMFRRFCCSELKEQYIEGNVLFGIRTEESFKRAIRYKEPTRCRIYGKNKLQQQYFPILLWSERDVADFVEIMQIKCHPLYYENGLFNPAKRLGCIGCPLKGDRGVSDFLNYPKMLKLWVKSYSKYLENHPNTEDVYVLMVRHLFYSNHGMHKFRQAYHGLFPAPDAKKILEDYFQIDLSI